MWNRAPFLAFCVFLLVPLALVYSNPVSGGQAIQLTVTPASNAVGGVRSNTVSCNLDASFTSMEKTTSLTIYAARPYGNPNDLDSLAGIDLWASGPKLLNGIAPSGAAVFGHIGTGSGAKSSLTFSWSSSRNSPVTWYKCVANGLDKSGNTVTISMSSESSDADARNASPPGKLNRLTNTQLNRVANSTAQLRESVQSVDANIGLLQENVQSLEEQVKGQNATIANLQERITSFIEFYKTAYLLENFDVSSVFRGSLYFVSKEVAPFNIRSADARCSKFGGYLVEIDDQAEFDFVFNYVKNVGGTTNFYTGGNDLDKEGDWRFWHSKNPVAFFKWGTGEPSTSAEHCIEIRLGHNGYNDWVCNGNAKFVCEARV